MAMGRRNQRQRQRDLWIVAADLPRTAARPPKPMTMVSCGPPMRLALEDGSPLKQLKDLGRQASTSRKRLAK